MWKMNFRKNKTQNILMFLIILLCSTLLTASFSILINLSKPFDDFVKQCDAAEALIYPYSKADEDVYALADEFNEMKEVKEAVTYRIHYISEEMTLNGTKLEAFMDLTEYNDTVFDSSLFLHGTVEDAKNLKSDECMIPACLSNKYDISLGDEISIAMADKTINYKVKVIYSEPFSCSNSFDSNLLVSKLPDGISSMLNLRVYGNDGYSSKDILDTYREQHDGMLYGMVDTIEDRKSDNLLVGNIIGAIFLAIGGIMLLVSCLIINFMIRNLMIKDAKTIAVYKTLGYSSNDILKMYTIFYFVIIGTACIIGITISRFITDLIISSIFDNIGMKAQSNVLTVGIPCFIAIVGFVLAIIDWIMIKSKKIKPIMAMNDMAQSNTKKHKYRGNSKLQFSPFGIALRFMRTDKKGFIGIIIMSVMTIASVNFAVISLDVAKNMKELNTFWLGVDACDVMVSLPDAECYENVKEMIGKDDKVQDYLSSQLSFGVAVKWRKGINHTVLHAFVYDSYEIADLPMAEGRNPIASNEIALTTLMADEYGKKVGDYIEIMLDGITPCNLLITGTYQTYYNMCQGCRLLSSTLIENNVPYEYSNISIYLKDGVNTDDYLNDLKIRVGNDGNVMPRTEVFKSIMDLIVEPQTKAIPPVVILIFLIGGVNIFSIIVLKNTKSQKTNGIYKSIGYSSGHLICANTIYVMILAVTSMIAAVPLMLVVYPNIMKLALSMFGFKRYPVIYDPVHLIIINAAILLVFLVFTVCSSLSIKKVHVRDLVVE